MSDDSKTKEQIMNELIALRKRNAELEASEIRQKRHKNQSGGMEALYRKMVDMSSDSIVLVDTEGVIKWCNIWGARMLGYSRDEMVGKHFSKLGVIPVRNLPKYQELFRSALGGKATESLELSFQRKDGTILRAEVRINLLKVGSKTFLQSTSRDISERKKAEEEIFKSQEFLNRILNGMHETIMVISPDYTIIDINDCFIKLYGRNRDEIIGRKCYEISHQSNRPCSEAEHPCPLKAVLESKSAVNVEHIHKDTCGEDVVVEISVFPLLTSDSEVEFVVEAQRDITERKRVEHDLRKRVKELNGLYLIDNVATRPNITLDEIYQTVVDILPLACQYPEISYARIVVYGKKLQTDNYRDTRWKQSSDIKINQKKIGILEVGYLKKRPGFERRHFLKEEKQLITAIAKHLTSIIGRKHIEDELKKSEVKYRNLVNNSNDLIALVNKKGNWIFLSPAVKSIMGYEPAELVGTSAFTLMLTEDIVSTREAHESIIKEVKSISEYENRYITKDGRVVTLTWNAIALKDEQDNIIGIYGIGRDITERKLAEVALKESEDRFYEAFHSNPHPMSIVTLKKGRYLDVNDSYVQTFGFSRKELLGRTSVEMGIIKTGRFRRRILQSLGERQAVKNLELELYTRSGRKVDALLSADKMEIGGQACLLSVITDITGRKWADDALRDAEQKWLSLTKNTNDIIMIADNKSKIQYINRAIPPHTPDKVIGKPVYYFAGPEFHEMIRQSLRKTFENGKQVSYVSSVKYPTGIQWFGTKIIPIMDGNEVTSAMLFCANITERKEAEEREKQLQQELILASRLATIGEMASGIAHEINNPLTGVVGYSGLLLKKDIPGDIRKYVDIIYEGAQRVASITNRMLTFARKHKPEKTSININDIVETSLDMQTYEMKSSNMEVTKKLDPNLPMTMADAGQLQQVFLNIILNAEIEMTRAHRGGNLTVKTERTDNTIRVSFKDDGPGISKENLGRIFDPFFTTREVGKGAGLGLSVSHGIVALHNGKIYAQSRLGKGATFFVELPIVTKIEQLNLAKTDISEPKMVSKGRVLVVDDEPTVQRYLTDVLSEEGHEIKIVDNGHDALERLSSEDYDVILLDIKLPGMSGIEIYQRLHKRTKSLARKVIFITGDVMSSSTLDFLARTSAPHITKPFDAKQLKKEMDLILSKQP